MITHAQLSSYINESALGGNHFVDLLGYNNKTASALNLFEGQMAPEAFLFFSPYSVVAYARHHRLRISFPWSGIAYFPEDPPMSEADARYAASIVQQRMERFRERMDSLNKALAHRRQPYPGASLFSRSSPHEAPLEIHRSVDGMWYTPTAARLRTLRYALDGLEVLPEEANETTEKRIHRLAAVGKLVSEGMPVEYAREMGRNV